MIMIVKKSLFITNMIFKHSQNLHLIQSNKVYENYC